MSPGCVSTDISSRLLQEQEPNKANIHNEGEPDWKGFAGLANGVHDQALNPETGGGQTRVCGHVGNHYGSIVEVLCPIRVVASWSRALAAAEGCNALDDGQVLQPFLLHARFTSCVAARFPGM